LSILEIAKWVGLALATVVLYELVRWRVVGRVKRRLRSSTKRFIQEHGVRLDRFKFTRRSFMKAELLSDPRIGEAIAERAKETGESVAVLRDKVEEWIDEIVPVFKVLSYYKVGFNLARLAIKLVYEVVIHESELKRLRERIPERAVVVYVMNHRSNADYVLVAYMLARNIALAFAVGEWARVWPLDVLFRSFGSYFVRRGFRDPLYHAVLRRYVQLTCRYGITQGVFPEGGLSRDGYLRPPKIGLIDYIVRIKEEGLEEDILFVPVGINYDRVLEDRTLLAEGKERGERKRPGLFAKARSLTVFLVRFPFIITVNLFRVVTGRVKRHGYATASFGEALSLDEWLGRNPDVFDLPRDERKERVLSLANEVMDAIGRVIPVTPVPLLALAAGRLGEEFGRDELCRSVLGLRDTLAERGARLVSGRGFEGSRVSRARLDEEQEQRSSDLLTFEGEITSADEAEETVTVALDLLERRGVIEVKTDRIRVLEPDLLAYYARSIEHLADPAADAPQPANFSKSVDGSV